MTNPASTPRRPGSIELAVLLGTMISVAPFSIDMYLPALPELGREFGTSIAEVQRTLTTFFIGFAAGQAFAGPFVDRFGRKPPLFVGLVLFILTSIGCAFAPSIHALAALRLLQALGACVGGVVARAVVRDLLSPQEGARMLSHMLLTMGIAPLVAPLVGGYVLIAFGWQAIFLILGGIGVLIFAASALRLPETLKPENARKLHGIAIVRDYAWLLRQRGYISYTVAGGLSQGGLFAYITASPHVFIDYFGVRAQNFGWIFAVNVAGMMVVSQLGAAMLKRHRSDTILRLVQSIQVTAGLALVIGAVTGIGGMWSILLPLVAYMACTGAVMPNATALAMADYGHIAGLAAALLGSISFGIAAMASFVVGIMPGEGAVPMAVTIAVCASAGLACNLLATRRRDRQSPI
ncbi:MAG: Bcr/CflA family multidrug efflux MFS transporter [Alphaproteobacteria bacterium]|nr:Bcr/CflA family multidrug efflux MFS transporter [Alphaproteobacteria bacterium]